MQAAEKPVILNWLPSATKGVAGYRIYYGSVSGKYTASVDAGNETSGSVCCLSQGQTYFFAVTAYLSTGEESEFSEEVAYRLKDPANVAPTIDTISDLRVDEDSDTQVISVAGIQAGAAYENQTLTITATSSEPSLIPDPTVDYTSPNATALLRFKPRPNRSGTATITVMVDDGQPLNNRTFRTFRINVSPINDRPQLDGIGDLQLKQNVTPDSVLLTGVGAGAPDEVQTLTITATSSDPTLIPHPTVRYTSPEATALLSFTSAPTVAGTATITVTVDDGQSSNNRITREFKVEVAAAPTTNTLFLEAESGRFTAAFEQAAHETASSGSFAFSRVPDQGTLELNFTIPEDGDYYLWARALVADSSTDSFYLQIDDSPEVIFYMGLQRWSQDWQWAEFRDWTYQGEDLNSRRHPLQLGKGPHRLTFRSREAFALLDAVFLTSSPEFTEPELKPNPITEPALSSPWRASSIGNHPGGQTLSVEGGSFILGSDGRLNGSSDTCLFINQDGDEDSQITAVLDVPAQLGEGGFAGIMIRQDLGSRSVYAALGVSSNRALQLNYRQATSNASLSTILPLEEGMTRCWLHLRRSDNTISTYASLNGIVWFPVEEFELPLTATAQLGLVFASGASPVTVTFSDASVLP